MKRASSHTFSRQRVTRGGGRVSPQIEERRRLVAFAELFADAPRKPDALHALTRREPRCQLPDEKQRSMIHDGIRAGVVSRERIVRYRATQLLDDLAQFGDTDADAVDVCYVRAMIEIAEAVEAQTVARALPTDANRLAAVRETREAVAELQCHVLTLPPRHVVPMGVR